MAQDSVKEVSDIIRKHKEYVFQISIPNNKALFSKKTESEVLIDHPCLEAYFKKIAEANKVDKYIVDLFSRNGNSYKKRGQHILVFQTEPVVAPATPAATSAP